MDVLSVFVQILAWVVVIAGALLVGWVIVRIFGMSDDLRYLVACKQAEFDRMAELREQQEGGAPKDPFAPSTTPADAFDERTDIEEPYYQSTPIVPVLLVFAIVLIVFLILASVSGWLSVNDAISQMNDALAAGASSAATGTDAASAVEVAS